MRTIVDAVTGAVVVDPAWSAEALEIEAAAPRTITRYQLRRWLREQHGITWPQVQALAGALDEPARTAALEWLECGVEADRSDPLVRHLALALPLGLTEATVDAALDQAWRAASGISS